MDSHYRYDRTLVKERVQNQLYVIDDSSTLTHLKQPEEGVQKYQVLKQDDLSEHRELNDSLTHLRKVTAGFQPICIHHRTITLRGQTHNLANGHLWKVQVKTRYEDEVYATMDRQALLAKNAKQTGPPSPKAREEPDKEADLERYEWRMVNLFNIAWTQRMIGLCSREVEHKDGSIENEAGFYAKVQPSTRRMDIVGLRGMRDCESVNFVSDDLFLFKFRSASRTGMQDYWSLIDRYGQIRHMNELAQRNLRWDTYACGDSQQMSHGCFICIKGGNRQILSEEADAVYEERHMNVLEFNRQGEAVNEISYRKEEYMQQLMQEVES